MSASFMGADLGIRIGMLISNPLIEKISSIVKGPRIIVLLLFELIFFTIFKALGPLPLVLWIKNFIWVNLFSKLKAFYYTFYIFTFKIILLNYFDLIKINMGFKDTFGKDT